MRERRRRATQQRRSDDDVDEDEDEDEAAAEDRRADGYAERLRLAWCGPQHGHSVPKVGTTHESCYARRRATKLRRRIALGWPPIECSVERSQGTNASNQQLAAVRLEIDRIGVVDDDDDEEGRETRDSVRVESRQLRGRRRRRRRRRRRQRRRVVEQRRCIVIVEKDRGT